MNTTDASSAEAALENCVRIGLPALRAMRARNVPAADMFSGLGRASTTVVGMSSFGKWPAVGVEIGFQVAALVALLVLKARHWQTGQHFHLYLMAYGLFRFAHEFLRATPKPFAGLSGYQLIALAMALAAALAYRQRTVSMVSKPRIPVASGFRQ